jgi:hydrogenase nickel incorporation protein HypA/HybF
MHESSLMADLVAKIEAAARANDARKVTAVEISVGPLSALEAGHLREHFAAAVAGTVAEGAELRVKNGSAYEVLLESVEMER